MSPRRPIRKAARTPARAWTIKAASAAAEREWRAASEAQPEIMAALRDRLKSRPLDRSGNPRRTHRLKSSLASRKVGAKTLPQWQHEITSGGRVWYCPDVEAGIVWVSRISLAPPRETH